MQFSGSLEIIIKKKKKISQANLRLSLHFPLNVFYSNVYIFLYLYVWHIKLCVIIKKNDFTSCLTEFVLYKQSLRHLLIQF